MAIIAPGGPFLVRTWFGSDEAWRMLGEAVLAETDEGFRAFLELVDDPAFDGASAESVVAALPPDRHQAFVAIADETSFTTAGAPVLVVEVVDGRMARTFRALPSAMQAIENNLSIANMDVDDFVSATDADGVFRGFGGPPAPPQARPPQIDPHADPHADAEMKISCDGARIHRLLWNHADGGIRLRHQPVLEGAPYPGFGPQQQVGPDEVFEIACFRCGLRVPLTSRQLEPNLRVWERMASSRGSHTSTSSMDLRTIESWYRGAPRP